MADDLPLYLQDGQTEDVIRQRMLDGISDREDKTEGGFTWDAIAPVAFELFLAIQMAQEVRRRGFAVDVASTVPGEVTDELTKRAAENGVPRKDATQAVCPNYVITGISGTVICAGYRVSTLTSGSKTAIIFATDAQVTIGVDGTITTTLTAVNAGSAGNVAANTITYLVDKDIDGITSVNNPVKTSGGYDIEDDVTLLPRYLAKVREPSAGGNRADYYNWAMEVAGVGGASVICVRDGPGTISIAIIDSDKMPADQALVDLVQEYIAPPWVNSLRATAMTAGGSGVSIQPDDTVQMIYDAGGQGTLTQSLDGMLQRPGIWMAKPLLKIDDIAGAADLLQIGIWNLSTNTWAKTAPSGLVDAVSTFKASDLAIDFKELSSDFYWNNSDQLETRIYRLVTDTTTLVTVDSITFKSAFSKDTGEGKAPGNARVTVESAGEVPINISVSMSPASAQDAAKQAIADYLLTLAFEDNTVKFAKIGDAILNAPGVMDYDAANMTINGDQANIIINEQQVAVLGTVTWL